MDRRNNISQLPRFSIASLLVLMIFAAIAAMAYRFIGLWSIFLLFVFGPAIMGACIGVMEWSHSSQPQRLLGIACITVGVLYLLIAVALEAYMWTYFGTGGGGVVLLTASPVIALFWFIQYTSVASMYD